MKQVVTYSKGDARRLCVVVGAIHVLKSASLVEIERFTGHNKGTIPGDIKKINQQLGITIEKKGVKYEITDWGNLIKKKGIIDILYG